MYNILIIYVIEESLKVVEFIMNVTCRDKNCFFYLIRDIN